MTEQEFLEKRIPFWLEGENLNVIIPSSTDRMECRSRLAKKYGYNALFAIRGYYWPGSHIMVYTGMYETPNITSWVAYHLFDFFNDAKYLGLGCHIGNPGELWKPKLCIVKDVNLISNINEQ